MGVREGRLIWGLDTPGPAAPPESAAVEGEPESREEGDTGPAEGGKAPFGDPEKAAEEATGSAKDATDKPRAEVEKTNRVQLETQFNNIVSTQKEAQQLMATYDRMPQQQKQITVLALDGIEGNDKKARFVELMGKFKPEHNQIIQKAAGGYAQQAAFLERVINNDPNVVTKAMEGLTPDEQQKLGDLVKSFGGDEAIIVEGYQKAAEKLKEQKGDKMAESFAKFLTMLSEFMEKFTKFFKDIEKAMKGEYGKEEGKEGGKDAKDVSPEVRKEQIIKRSEEITERIPKNNDEMLAATQGLNKLEARKTRFEDSTIAGSENDITQLEEKISVAKQKVQKLKDERASLNTEYTQLMEELAKIKKKEKDSPEKEGDKESPEKNTLVEQGASEKAAEDVINLRDGEDIDLGFTYKNGKWELPASTKIEDVVNVFYTFSLEESVEDCLISRINETLHETMGSSEGKQLMKSLYIRDSGDEGSADLFVDNITVMAAVDNKTFKNSLTIKEDGSVVLPVLTTSSRAWKALKRMYDAKPDSVHTGLAEHFKLDQ